MSAPRPDPTPPGGDAPSVPWQSARAVRHLQRQGLGRHDAEDCAQEAALRLVGALAAGRVRDVRPGLVARLLAHARIDSWRRARTRDKVVGRSLPADAAARETLDPGDRLDVVEALQRLPAVQREALRLTVHEGLSYADAAAHLGVPVGTVKSRAARAVAALRGRLA